MNVHRADFEVEVHPESKEDRLHADRKQAVRGRGQSHGDQRNDQGQRCQRCADDRRLRLSQGHAWRKANSVPETTRDPSLIFLGKLRVGDAVATRLSGRGTTTAPYRAVRGGPER